MEIVKIDPKEFGMEETKAADISAQFKPMLDKMVELETEYNEVIKLPRSDPKTAATAKALRLKYVKVRTGTADIHKEQKAFYLSAGRFIDGWKNAQLFASEGIEKSLEEIERYAENLEKERIAKLQEERTVLLAPYQVENLGHLNLGVMDEQVFNNFLEGTKVSFERKQEAERLTKEAEEKRIADEKAEQERIRLENIELKKEQDRIAEEIKQKELIRSSRQKELQMYLILIRDYNGMLEMDEEAYQKELSEIKIGWDQHCAFEREKAENLEKERKAAEDEKNRLWAENEKKLKEERLEREKLEKELQNKKDAEAKAESDRLSAIETELSKGDKEKFESLLSEIESIKSKYQFKSKKHQSLQNQVNLLIDKIIAFANPKL